MKRNVLSLLLCGVIACSLLTACGGSDDSAKSGVASSVEESANEVHSTEKDNDHETSVISETLPSEPDDMEESNAYNSSESSNWSTVDGKTLYYHCVVNGVDYVIDHDTLSRDSEQVKVTLDEARAVYNYGQAIRNCQGTELEIQTKKTEYKNYCDELFKLRAKEASGCVDDETYRNLESAFEQVDAAYNSHIRVIADNYPDLETEFQSLSSALRAGRGIINQMMISPADGQDLLDRCNQFIATANAIEELRDEDYNELKEACFEMSENYKKLINSCGCVWKQLSAYDNGKYSDIEASFFEVMDALYDDSEYKHFSSKDSFTADSCKEYIERCNSISEALIQ